MDDRILTPEERARIEALIARFEERVASRRDAATVSSPAGAIAQHGIANEIEADAVALRSALRIIDRLSASPWRPVTEVEPALGVPVLAAWSWDDGGGSIGIAMRASGEDHWRVNREDVLPPSHWMPLPLVPEGKP